MSIKRVAVVVCAAIAGLFIGAAAWASIPGPDGVIHGCRKNTDGSLRAIDSEASCPNGYTALNWAAGPAAGTLFNAYAQQGTVTVQTGTGLYQVTCPGTRRVVSAYAWFEEPSGMGDRALAAHPGVNGTLIDQTITIHSGSVPAGEVIRYEMLCADWS